MLKNSANVMAPLFVRNFNCAGDKCPDHCCHSWRVAVDKKSYKQLKKSNNIILRQLANANMDLTRTSDEDYAAIKMDKQGNCPFLDKSMLCEVQKNSGHQALPHTCQEYPRTYHFFGEQVEASMIMSCPTVTHEVLFNTDAFMFESSSQLIKNLNHSKIAGLPEENLPAWLPIVRDFCFNIILSEDLSVNERLFIMGMYLKQAEPHLNNTDKLGSMINSYIDMVADNTLQEMYANLAPAPALKWQIFHHQDKAFISTTPIRSTLDESHTTNYTISNSDARFNECRVLLIELLRDHNKVDSLGLMFDKVLIQANQSILPSYFDKNPQVLTNYILYYLYHNQFLITKNKSPFEFYRIMLTDFFMLTSYLSGIAVHLGELNNEWVGKLFQSYSRRRQHKSGFIDGIEEQLKQAGGQGPAAIFSLLK